MTRPPLFFGRTPWTSQVNVAINAPTGWSFLGGSITDEEHNVRPIGRVPRATDGRVWPYYRPVKAASAYQIYVTKDQHVDFTSDQLFVQHSLGYVEAVATPNTTALYTAIPPWTLSSSVGYIDYTYGWDFTMTEETLTTVSGQLWGSQQHWNEDEDVVLTKDGVLVVEADYEVDYVEGVITPDTPPASEVWKASYHYKLPPGVVQATALIATDLAGASAIASSGMLGLSGIKVEEVELRQSSKVNFYVTPVNPAANMLLAQYRSLFTVMR
jgi:hypothetical protein